MTIEAKQVPLYEQLEDVPIDARLVIDDSDGMGATILAIGRMCHGAAAALRAALEPAERQQTHSEECWKWHHECAVAKINQLQAGIETLHAMYEQACQQRDYLMDQQRAQIEAMRGRVQ